MEPEACYLRVKLGGRSSVQGPIPFAHLKQSYLEGKLGDHCELIDADGLSPTDAKRATGWQGIAEYMPAKPPESTEDLLRRLIVIQEQQVYWMRMIAIMGWVSFVLVFVFGMMFRLK